MKKHTRQPADRKGKRKKKKEIWGGGSNRTKGKKTKILPLIIPWTIQRLLLPITPGGRVFCLFVCLISRENWEKKKGYRGPKFIRRCNRRAQKLEGKTSQKPITTIEKKQTKNTGDTRRWKRFPAPTTRKKTKTRTKKSAANDSTYVLYDPRRKQRLAIATPAIAPPI